MSSKLDDPQWRIERARKAGRAGAVATKQVWHEARIAAAVDAVVAAAPELRPDQVSRLRAVFAPAVEKMHAEQQVEARAS
jgi:hypothetical protein